MSSAEDCSTLSRNAMDYKTKLNALSASGNLRHISSVRHDGRWIWDGTHRMLNLSSNDYLGLASEPALVSEFLDTCPQSSRIFSSSSSRLLTGNFEATEELEDLLARAYCRPAALLFNSGYHANTGILPALAEKDCLILADKLVHASLIDGLKLSPAPFLRFRHQDMDQLERIVAKESQKYRLVFIVVESIYSMDGDVTDLRRLSALRKRYKNICLYVDEAHAVGVRGPSGLGIAEEQGVISDIEMISVNSALVIHPLMVTTRLLISSIEPTPPPKLNAPRRRNVVKRSKRIMGFLLIRGECIYSAYYAAYHDEDNDIHIKEEGSGRCSDEHKQ